MFVHKQVCVSCGLAMAGGHNSLCPLSQYLACRALAYFTRQATQHSRMSYDLNSLNWRFIKEYIGEYKRAYEGGY